MAVTLNIKHMVCPRCITVIENELQKHEIPYLEVALGKITLTSPLPENSAFMQALEAHGFEQILSPEARTSENIRHALITLVNDEALLKSTESLSGYLQDTLDTSYFTLTKHFSRSEGLTIEKYLIQLKIKKARELINDGELSAKEIAFRLGYSSTQHFYRQFKAVSGTSVKEYRELVS